MFQGFDKKKLSFWFLWSIVGTLLIAQYYFQLMSSNWGAILGFLLFAVFLTPPVVIFFDSVQGKINILNKKTIILIVSVFAALFFLYYGLFSLFKQDYFFAGYDLAIFDQAIWKMSHFEVPSSSIRNVPVVFADHFHPLISILAPFYWLWPDPRALLILQVFILVLGVIPIYLICREFKISNFFIILLTLFYFVSPGLHGAAVLDFHEIIFSPVLILSIFYFLLKRKYVLYFLFILFLMLVKENLTIFVIFLGLFLLFKKSTRLVGMTTIFLGIVAFFTITLFIMPSLGSPGYSYFELYPGFEGGFFKGVLNIFKNPSDILKVAISPPEKWWVSVFFLLPILPAIIFVPQGFLLFLPAVLEKAFSQYVLLWFMGYHYNLIFVPLQIIVFIYAIKRIQEIGFAKRLEIWFKKLRLSFSLILLVFPLLFFFAYSYQFSFFSSRFII